jgi:MSHA pilin protein MshA
MPRIDRDGVQIGTLSADPPLPARSTLQSESHLRQTAMKSRTPTPTRNAGFTLAGLLFVLLFLGILAALTLPRYLDIRGDARAAKQQAVFDSVRAAAQLTHAAALLRHKTGANDAVTVDGAVIATNYGYPQAIDAGIVAAAGFDAGGANSLAVRPQGGGVLPGSTLTIAIDGAPETCSVSYSSPASADATPLITFSGSAGNGC